MTVLWTPRPPNPDEPACWSWPIPPLVVDVEEEVARWVAEQAHLPYDERRDPSAIRFMLDANPDGERLERFQQGRCAVCGTPRGDHVLDHCHRTGQWRGWACRSCNVLEGKSGHPLFVRYRRIHPASILGMYQLYDDGIWWRQGWHITDHRRSRGPRPMTPWPAWSPDAPVDTGPLGAGLLTPVVEDDDFDEYRRNPMLLIGRDTDG